SAVGASNILIRYRINRLRCCPDQLVNAFFQLSLVCVTHLRSVGCEHLDAVILIWIVRGGNHDTAGIVARLGEQRDTWGWNHTGVFNRRPSRGDARFQMLEDPWTRHTRVLADEDFPRHLLADGLADRL